MTAPEIDGQVETPHPCPFCGKVPVRDDDGWMSFHVPGCWFFSPHWIRGANDLRKWNTRANAGAVPRRGSDVGTSPLLGISSGDE